MKFLTKEKFLKVANLASIGFIIILLPPLIDYYIFHYSSYTYIPKDKLLFFLTFMYPKIHGAGGPALALQLLFILFLTSLYIYLKTGSILKSTANLILINTMTAFVSIPTINPWIERVSFGFLSQPIYMVRQLLLSFIFLASLLAISKKGLLKSFLKSMGLLRASHFVLMGVIGIWIVGKIRFSKLSYGNSGNIGMILLTMLLLFFLWEYAVMINNFYDAKIDRITKRDRITSTGIIPIGYVKELAIIFAIVSIALSFSLGGYQLLLSAFSIFLATIYSAPPIRLRNKMFSNATIGIGSSVCFLIGYFTPLYIETNGIMQRVYPNITSDLVGIAVLIFAALTAGSLVKDIDDYKGDLKNGVKNIFTVYGVEKGVKIIILPVFFSFLSPLLLIHKIYDFAILILFGGLASILFIKMKNSRGVFLLYIAALIYAMARYFL